MTAEQRRQFINVARSYIGKPYREWRRGDSRSEALTCYELVHKAFADIGIVDFPNHIYEQWKLPKIETPQLGDLGFTFGIGSMPNHVFITTERGAIHSSQEMGDVREVPVDELMKTARYKRVNYVSAESYFRRLAISNNL